MRRPLALVGFAYLLTQAVSVLIGTKEAFMLAVVTLAAGAIFLLFALASKNRKYAIPVVLLTAAAASFLFSVQSAPLQTAAEAAANQEVRVSGIVCEPPAVDSSGSTHYVIQIDDGKWGSGKALEGYAVQVTAYGRFHAQLSDRVTASLDLYMPEKESFFSQQNRLRADGILLQGSVDETRYYTVEPGTLPAVQGFLEGVRSNISRVLSASLAPEDAALAEGLLLGGSSGLSQETRSDFRDAGIYHLLSVSGLHMAVIAQFLLFVCGLLPLPRRVRPVFACAGVLLFMGVADFVPSVVRSGVMCLLMLGGQFFSRRADGLNSLGFAVLLLCLAHPYAAADVSLLLSVSATLGLLLCMPRWTAFYQKHHPRSRVLRVLVRELCGAVVTSAAATVFTLPVSLFVFESQSLVSPLANLLVLQPSTWLLYLLIFGLLFTTLLPVPFLAGLCWQGAALLSQWLQKAAAFCARLPFAAVCTDYTFVKVWVLCALLIFGAALLLGRCLRRPPLWEAALCSALLLACNAFLYASRTADACRVFVAGSGSGVSAVVSYHGQSVVIGCGAGQARVQAILRRCGTRSLEAVALLSDWKGEVQRASQILQAWQPARLLLPADVEQADLPAAAAAPALQGASALSLWDGRALLLYDASAALLEVEGTSILFVGAYADYSELPAAFLDADVLVCAALPSGEEAEALQPSMTCLCAYPDEQIGENAAAFAAYARAHGQPIVMGNAQDLVLEPHLPNDLKVRRND